MKPNKSLALFLQVLAEKIVVNLHQPKDIDFVNRTLEMTNDFLLGNKKADPDLLYERLENLDEEDILTYFELDAVTKPEVWICIADAVAYICLVSYTENGDVYLPETIESVDEQTLTEFLDNYQKCLLQFSHLKTLKTELLTDSRVDLEDAEVKESYQSLFA